MYWKVRRPPGCGNDRCWPGGALCLPGGRLPGPTARDPPGRRWRLAGKRAGPIARLDYQAAGVSIEAGDRAVALMRDAVARTSGPEVVGGIGGFAGLFDASGLTRYRRPLLATATDGVGTKVVIAQRLSQYGTIGLDLVAMVVDDLVTCGAEPLFMTDYVVFGTLVAERAAEVVAGRGPGM